MKKKKQKLENYLLQFWKLMPRRENTVNFILTSDLIKMKYHFRSKAQFCARQMKTMILVYIEDLHNQEENNNFRTIIYVFENSKKRQETEDFTVTPYTLPASTFILAHLIQFVFLKFKCELEPGSLSYLSHYCTQQPASFLLTTQPLPLYNHTVPSFNSKEMYLWQYKPILYKVHQYIVQYYLLCVETNKRFYYYFYKPVIHLGPMFFDGSSCQSIFSDPNTVIRISNGSG